VPKKELVSDLQVLLQSRRQRMAPPLPDAPTFVRKLLNFKMQVTAANQAVESWREAPHDDRVLAAATAVWLGERGTRRLWILW
jgi:hypothetical protein